MEAWDILPFCVGGCAAVTSAQLLSRWALISRSETSLEHAGLHNGDY